MKKYFEIIVSLLICFLFFSCEKNENSVASTLITLGDTTNMKITSIDSFITAYSSTNNRIKLDIDHDGINDYELTNLNTKGPQMSWDITADIRSLDPQKYILGDVITDTLFQDDTITTSIGSNNLVIYNLTQNIRCNQITPNYRILQTRNTFRLRPLIKNESFNSTDFFEAGDFEFWENSDYSVSTNQYNDTIFYYTYSRYRCFALPSQVPIYFGVRINKANRPKYGWIKLINDYSSLIILETAIQK